MGIYGQDWSSYQSAAPDTSGLAFAFTKVTEGLGYVNPEWASQRDHAKANGLVWDGYHYPHMGNSVEAEADYFLAQVAWKHGDLVVLDWEGYDAANQAVSYNDQRAYKESWLRYVKGKLPHNPVGVYCNTDYWRRIDTTGFYRDFLWIATAGLPAGRPGIRAAVAVPPVQRLRGGPGLLPSEQPARTAYVGIVVRSVAASSPIPKPFDRRKLDEEVR
ncbi:GH25 family lysozyme [Streptomyces sp. CG1]|uniref:GH25 family lysozyme n=1 Tax=Streptomyces sp. CG1 TaxID=1287523 RepID=UPI0034E2116A